MIVKITATLSLVHILYASRTLCSSCSFDAEKLRFADMFFVTTYLRKTVMESDRKLVRACGGHDLDRSQCFKWFRKFKSGDFDVNVEDHIKTEKMPNFKQFWMKMMVKCNKNLQNN